MSDDSVGCVILIICLYETGNATFAISPVGRLDILAYRQELNVLHGFSVCVACIMNIKSHKIQNSDSFD